MGGILVSFEGVEGSGKSTQCQRLVETLTGRGIPAVLTREPDGTLLGTDVRRIFAADRPLPTPLAQTFLFAAARQQHVEEVIRPALGRGAVVVSDRYADATLAYQGYGQGLALEVIRDLNVLATGGLFPDLTVLLDLDPAVGMTRIRGRGHDALERLDLGFHRRVREGYLEIARADKRRVVLFPADQDADALARAIVATVEERLARGKAEHGGA
jgi:dTMP kinase